MRPVAEKDNVISLSFSAYVKCPKQSSDVN
jgi:hypothetical protein